MDGATHRHGKTYTPAAQNLANSISATSGLQNGASVLANTAGSVFVGGNAGRAVDDDDNHRRLSSTARRLLTLLALLEAGGLLTEEFLTSVESFETVLDGPPRRLRAMLRQLEAIGEDDEE